MHTSWPESKLATHDTSFVYIGQELRASYAKIKQVILPCRRYLYKKLHEDRNLSFNTHWLHMTQIPVTSINNYGHFMKRPKELFPHKYGPTTGSFMKIHMSVKDHSAYTWHKIP